MTWSKWHFGIATLLCLFLAFMVGRLSVRNGGEKPETPATDRQDISPSPSVRVDAISKETLEVPSNIGETTGSSSSQSTLTDLASIPDSAKRRSFAKRVFSSMDESEISQSIANLDKIPPGLGTDDLRLELLLRWAELNGREAVDAANAMPGSEKLALLEALLPVWGSAEPREAWEWLLHNRTRTHNRDPIVDKLRRAITLADTQLSVELGIFAADDYAKAAIESGGIQSALTFLEGLTDDKASRWGIARMAQHWAKYDPEAALAWVFSLGEDGTRDRFSRTSGYAILGPSAMTAALRGWASKDPHAAASWALQFTGDQRDTAVEWVFYEWNATGDAQKMASWLNQFPADPALDGAVNVIVGPIARTDPESAITWADSIFDEGKRLSAYLKIATHWTENGGIEEVETWAQGIEEEKSRNEVLKRAVLNLIYRDPARAVQTTTLLSTPAVRDSALLRILVTWSHREPERAGSFLESTDQISDEAKERIREKLRPIQ